MFKVPPIAPPSNIENGSEVEFEFPTRTNTPDSDYVSNLDIGVISAGLQMMADRAQSNSPISSCSEDDSETEAKRRAGYLWTPSLAQQRRAAREAAVKQETNDSMDDVPVGDTTNSTSEASDNLHQTGAYVRGDQPSGAYICKEEEAE